MKFNKQFFRRKGAGAGTVIGTDGAANAVPSEPPNTSRDNILSIKPFSNSGWPCHRVAIGYGSPSGAVGTDLPCELWIFDHLSERWYRVDAKNLVLNRITFFDIVALIDQATTLATLGEPSSGAIEMFIKVLDNATPDGLYVFTVGADLTPLAV